MCDFQEGEEVVCVDDSPGRATGAPCDLRRGATYVVVVVDPVVSIAGILVRVCSLRVSGSSRYWDQSRFRRPIVDESVEKTDVGTDAEVLA